MTTKSEKVLVQRTPAAKGLPLPEYHTAGSAGMDLRAALPENASVTLEPGKAEMIPTGLRIAIPEGFEGQIRPRSGLALKHGVGLPNSPGTIDADYRGDLNIIMMNYSRAPFTIRRGERIAQIVFQRVEQMNWVEVETLPETARGEGGFGHTGKH